MFRRVVVLRSLSYGKISPDSNEFNYKLHHIQFEYDIRQKSLNWLNLQVSGNVNKKNVQIGITTIERFNFVSHIYLWSLLIIE